MLDGPTLAEHLSRARSRTGTTRRIAKLNPASSCRDQAIAVVHRSDGSGTTFNFTDYLSQGQPGMEAQGRRGDRRWNGRSASAPRAMRASPTTSTQTNGSIGYVEYAYAQAEQDDLRQDDEQGRQNRRARRRQRSRPPPPMPTGTRCPAYYLILTDQPGAESGRSPPPPSSSSTSSRRSRRPPPRR